MTSFHFVTGSVVGKPDFRLREIYVEGQEPNSDHNGSVREFPDIAAPIFQNG
jgi:hypothetical protein